MNNFIDTVIINNIEYYIFNIKKRFCAIIDIYLLTFTYLSNNEFYITLIDINNKIKYQSVIININTDNTYEYYTNNSITLKKLPLLYLKYIKYVTNVKFNILNNIFSLELFQELKEYYENEQPIGFKFEVEIKIDTDLLDYNNILKNYINYLISNLINNYDNYNKLEIINQLELIQNLNKIE